MLTPEDWEQIKLICMTRQECNLQMDAQSKEFSDYGKELTAIKTKQDFTIGILACIGAAVIAAIVKLYF